jgi:hypothetical protein
MPNAILDGLSLVDSTGRFILATNVAALLAGLVAHAALRARYAAIERDLEKNAEPSPHFIEPVLRRTLRDLEAAVGRSPDANTQAVIEDAFQSELKPMLVAERFVRAATGLVLVLGLLGTFYGLTLSIGKLANLVSADTAAVGDVAQTLTFGLTQGLSGMAVAFSNSLLGVTAAVVLTVLGVVNNVTDRRMALMIRVETFAERLLPARSAAPEGGAGSVAAFGEAVSRLDATVARFESALQNFVVSTKGLKEIELVVALKPRDGG